MVSIVMERSIDLETDRTPMNVKKEGEIYLFSDQG